MRRAAVGTKKPPMSDVGRPLFLLLSLLLGSSASPVVPESVAARQPTASPPRKLGPTVGRLAMSGDTATRFARVGGLADMDFQDDCGASPVISEDDFEKSLMRHYEWSVCTVIYNVSRELESKNVEWNESSANKYAETFKSNADDMYEVWKDVSQQSTALKLLMSHLNEPKKWKSVCYNFNDGLFPYCKFLHVEVLLLREHKESPIKLNAVSPESNKVVDPVNDTIDSITEINANSLGDINSSPDDVNDGNEDDEPNIINPINDLSTDKSPVPLPPNKPKASDSVDLDSKENFSPSPTDTKKVQSLFSNKFTNHQEESHFLLYFIIMTVLSMMFYLALYNKKKIIALLLEGRRSTNHRRRPNSTSYSKVETDDGTTVY